MNPCLWQPSKEQIESSELNGFMGFLSGTHGFEGDNYPALHRWSVSNTALFWQSIWQYFEIVGQQGDVIVHGQTQMPGATWFPEASLNFAENLLQHATNSPNDIAIVERGEHGRQEALSYQQLYDQVSYLADYLKKAGVVKGDRVAGFLPNCQYSIIGMLATASLGAIWSSCSPDFGVNGVRDRFAQIEPKILIACDGYYYAGKCIDSYDRISEISSTLTSLQTTIIAPYLNEGDADLDKFNNGFTPWKSIFLGECPSLEFIPTAFNDPLYIMYSSGTTGMPKCIVHTVGGTLLQHLKELSLHTNVTSQSKLFYFTTCGWMMWNWMVSGLALGATVIVFDGSPFHPTQTVLFDLIDEEKIDVFGASAKYYSACEKFGLLPKDSHTLSSVNTLLSTGSPLSHESFDYLYNSVKADVCVSSISGGTDIISCFALGCPILPVFKGELQCLGLAMDVHFTDESCNILDQGKGELVCKSSFPSMPLGFWNDSGGNKYHNAYFDRFDNVWAHGDYGELTSHEIDQGTHQRGVIIHGRSDAVLNPGGVRIGTAEIYRQVEKVTEVLESIAIGQHWKDDVRVVLFVRLRDSAELDNELIKTIKQSIRQNTTPRHVPSKIVQVTDIPRTLSGKIVELAVKKIVHGDPVNNTDALANPAALELYKEIPELQTD